MKLVNMSCPNCGSHLTQNDKTGEYVCSSCGGSFILDDEKQHIQYDNAEDAGYQFEKGRQRAQAENAPRVVYVQTSSSSSHNVPRKKRKTWLWVLGWICLFPLPLTILLLRKKDMKPALKYGIIAAAWIIYLIIGIIGNINNSDNTNTNNTVNQQGSTASATVTETEASVTNATTAEANIANAIDTFVAEFNASSETDLVYVEDFTPYDKTSSHYRTEFRLNAYREAVGKSYLYNDLVVDIVYRESTLTGGAMRVYADGATLEQCKEIIATASPIMDKDMDETTMQETISYIDEHKEANGYYYSNLGLVLLKHSDGYEMMIKMKND